MSTALTYHAATKYHPATVGNGPGLDWAQQPETLKRYDCPAPVPLATWLPLDPNPFAQGESPSLGPVGGVSLGALSRLIYFTYGITGMIPGASSPTYLRAAPSAGGLYPAELYLVVRDWPEVPPGLYGYDPTKHQLIPLWEDAAVAVQLAEACYGNAAVAAAPVCLVVTAVFQRSRWRYQERAYRRILLDTGHLLGNALLAAHALGLRAHATTAFCDRWVGDLLRLDAAAEGALAVVAVNSLGPAERPSWTALPSSVGPADAAPPLLDALHRSSGLPATRPRLIAADDAGQDLAAHHGWSAGVALTDGLGPGALGEDICGALLHRRSTRAFHRGSMTRAQLAAILATGYRPEACGLGPGGGFDRGRLMTFVAILDVGGLEPGVYYLSPHALDLRPVRLGVTRDAVHHLCLGQDLGGDAAAVIFHTADLAAAVKVMGDRAYRHLHLDAGLIGQRLDLGALAEGAGASGIGGFFDDQAADLLGIPREQAIVYITVLGVPA